MSLVVMSQSDAAGCMMCYELMIYVVNSNNNPLQASVRRGIK